VPGRRLVVGWSRCWTTVTGSAPPDDADHNNDSSEGNDEPATEPDARACSENTGRGEQWQPAAHPQHGRARCERGDC
jgi:hypothetical protein